MRFIDMFCGIGGFRLGLEKANPTKQEGGETRQTAPSIARERNWGRLQPIYRCVWANDNDRYACQIYRRHYNDGTLHEGDLRAVDADSIPEHDLLCAGFPCQSFSIAGKRRGFEDTRGTLFFEICRVLRAKRPRMLLLENVKGLLSDDEGRTFLAILESLDELGYDCEWQVLNSKDFGVPQNRARVFIIGHLRGEPRPKVFPIGETGEDACKPELEYIGAIMSEQNQKWLQDGKQLNRNFPQGQRVYSSDGIASNICGDAGGLGGKTGLYVVMDPLHHHRTGEYGDGVKENESFTLDSSSGRDLIINKIRRLTPLECERLQGFPDGWTEGISDTQRYKCLGNAVTVNVIGAVGGRLLEEASG